MTDDEKQDSTNELDEQKETKPEDEPKQGPPSSDSAAPADDDIIIK
jgi:hypothetical protein